MMVFAIHQHELATDILGSTPIPSSTSPTSLPTPPPRLSQTPTLGALLHAASRSREASGHLFYKWSCIRFHAILSNPPTLSFNDTCLLRRKPLGEQGGYHSTFRHQLSSNVGVSLVCERPVCCPWGVPGASLVVQTVKNLPAMEDTAGSTPGSGRSPGRGHGDPTRVLAWKNPTDRGAWQAALKGVAKSRTD